MPATPTNSTPPLSRPLRASHELLTTRKYCRASIPFRTIVRHPPCLVLATTNTTTSNNHLHICTSIYLFRSPLFVFLYEVGRALVEGVLVRLRFSPHCASRHYQLLETTHHAQSEFGNLTLKKYRDVFYSAVLLIMTDPSPLFANLVLCFISFACPITFPRTSTIASE